VTASFRLVLALLSGLALGGTSQAQKKPESSWVSLRVHDEDTSRAVFDACDANADDRLSVFEALQCLERMGSLEDPQGFRALDTDKDGQLSWPEFDRHYRGVCERGGTFRLRPTRPFEMPRGSRRASAPELAARSMMRLGDKDKSRSLDRNELRSLLAEFKLPEDVGKQGFLLLDADRSGGVDEKELLVLLQTLPGLMALARKQEPAGDGCPTSADRNGDGKVTRQELEEALRALHPTLARWSRKVLKDADANEDGVLTANELHAPAAKR